MAQNSQIYGQKFNVWPYQILCMFSELYFTAFESLWLDMQLLLEWEKNMELIFFDIIWLKTDSSWVYALYDKKDKIQSYKSVSKIFLC